MAETLISKNYHKEKVKEKTYSFFVILCSFLAPISFSFLLQKKVNLFLSFLVGVTFIVMIFLFIFFRQSSLKKLESSTKDLKKGMRLKRKTGTYFYEITQESPNFYFLIDTKSHHKLMVSKDKVHKEFEIEL